MRTLILLLTFLPAINYAQVTSALLHEKLDDSSESPVHGMSIVIKREGNIVLSEAIGKRKKNGEGLLATDQFRIASSTKLFVSTITLQLLEEGKLHLSEKIYPYLNEIEYLRLDEFHSHENSAFAEFITIEQLLSHKSGLADIFNDKQEAFFERLMNKPKQQYRPKDVVDLYFEFGLNKKAKFEPGDGWYYSDMNYVLLGLLIEKLDQKSLSQSIRDRIIRPLDLKDTYFEFYEKTETTKSRLHQYVGTIDFNAVNTSFDWSGGGLVSTHQDLATFIEALFEGELISEQSLQKMIVVEGANENHLPYGLGVYQSVYDGQTFYGHYGFYGTYIGYCPENKMVLSYCITQATTPFNVYEFVSYIVKKSQNEENRSYLKSSSLYGSTLN
ncbi:serine hydrolase domain-containing protein [uncultured Croceitalea sp.]|uniref:serine hydrolase domain-containing protein n=1 Tax=uncultured Croceitalea sp. TaxID=1798908 RepID=UPI003306229C